MMMLMPGCGLAFMLIFLTQGSMKNNMGLPEWFCWIFAIFETSLLLYGILRLFWWSIKTTMLNRKVNNTLKQFKRGEIK